jgi:hypothetical protein
MPTERGIIDKAADQCVRAILYGGAVKATKYISEKLTVKATRKLYGKKRLPSRKAYEIVLTAGKPNHEERAFIKKLGKAGEPFPVKKVQLKMPK